MMRIMKNGLLRVNNRKALLVFSLSFLLCLSQALFAHPEQEYKVTIVGRNIPISKVFKEIQKQTGLYAFYNNDLLNDREMISVDIKGMQIENAMKVILKGKNLSFTITGSNIIISKDKNIAPIEHLIVSDEHLTDTIILKKIAGKVTSAEDNSPLSFASVTILHSKRGTNTNNSGEFTLEVKPGDTLRVSYAGKASKSVAVGHQSYFNISLVTSDETLAPEVVVTGFQKIDKRKFTGSAAKVKMDDIKQEGVMDVARMLEGRVAGVTVENVSGTFGTAPKIRIRGATSISGSNKPLWVVDGIVLEDIVNVTNDQLSSGDATTMLGSSVAGINTNDIESLDILRDASATALYGARAMNGVIVITTKKGKSGKTQINYSGTFSSILKPNYKKFNIMNSAQQMSVDLELAEKGWLNFSDVSRNPTGGVFAKASDLVSKWDKTEGKFGLDNNVDSLAEFYRRYGLANTDWFDVLFRNSFAQEHNLSLSFGTDKSQSYFSTNFYQDNGWTIGDRVNRYTANFHNTYNASDRLTLGFLTNASYRQQMAPGTVDRTSNKVSGGFDRDFDINPFNYALSTSRIITPYDENGNLEYFRKNFAPFNIVNELQNNTLDVNVLDAKLQGDLGYKISKDLKFDFTGAIRLVQSSLEHQITENSNMAQAYRAADNSFIRENNKFLYRDPEHPDDEPQVVLPKGGFYNRTDNRMLNWSIRNLLTYTKDFNRNNSLNVMGGMEIKATDRRVSNNTGYGYQYNSGGIPFVDYRALKQLLEANFNYYGLANTRDRFVAFFGNGSYTYKGRYTLNGTVREDGSNGLGKSTKSRWLPTWTVGGAWNIFNEPLIHDFLANNYVNRVNLRGSYGLSADFGPANNSSVILSMETSKRPTLAEQESGMDLVSLENKDLTWEKKYEGNVGLDLGFFKDRLTLVTDVYRRNSFDLISLIPTAGVGGQVFKAANYADMESHGVEFTLGGKIIAQRAFTWGANLTFGYNITKITNIKSLSQIADLVSPQGGSSLGYPVRSIFSIPFKGLDHYSGVPLFTDESGNTNTDVFLQSSNTSNLKYEGSADPLYTGGLSNVFTYKNLSLNILFVYQAGNKVRLSPVFGASYSDMNAMSKDFINRWEAPGDETKTNIPSISDSRIVYFLGSSSPYGNYNYSDVRVARGSFVRLKTVALTYSLPGHLTKSIGINNSSLTFTGNNLWLIGADKKLKGQDPEFANSGGVGSPVFTQLSLALKIGF
ncbi:SusC/RagA family TonB-linked outer membrane protein [Pinibacter aurantiacus]|nr:SusC/RagA family TonB-linked outer membrane protein [Pinibacter aurantiacus]